MRKILHAVGPHSSGPGEFQIWFLKMSFQNIFFGNDEISLNKNAILGCCDDPFFSLNLLIY